MKAGIIIVSEYSKGRNFEEAVANLFKNGLMNDFYITCEVESREQARRDYHSCYSEICQAAAVNYIVTEKYNEDNDEWWVDYTEGIEILPCQ